MSVCIVIPARLKSTRLPEKALAEIHGKPMIQHVYERACKVKGVDQVLVATDHQRIVTAVEKFGGKAVLTPETLSSGTDRVAFVAKSFVKTDIFINVQGDEPLLEPTSVEGSLELVLSGLFPMATPAGPLKDEESLKNPNIVKVIVAHNRQAVYFSRLPIPYGRGSLPRDPKEFAPRHHLGVYVYTKETLLKFSSLPQSPWERLESLEQLRALYYGIPIGVSEAKNATQGVDTAEDLQAVCRTMT